MAPEQNLLLGFGHIGPFSPIDPAKDGVVVVRPKDLDIIVIETVDNNMQPRPQQTCQYHRKKRWPHGEADQGHGFFRTPVKWLDIIDDKPKNRPGKPTDQKGMEMPKLMHRPAGLDKFIGNDFDINQDIGRDEYGHIDPPAKQQPHKPARSKMIRRKRHD